MGRSKTSILHLLALCSAITLSSVGSAYAQARPRDDRSSSADEAFVELTPETRVAIRQGVEWLAKNQLSPSGRWASRPSRYQMSVTALSGLALMAHGVTLDRGPHARVLRSAVTWILENQHREGPYVGLLCDQRDVTSENARPMHGHGFALLLLAQAHGSGHDETFQARIANAIRLGIRLTARTMSRDGGWFYWPRADRGDEGSVTITQIQALRAARNAGFAVDKSVLDRSVQYIRESQGDDGGVHYQRPRHGPTSAALTAAGIVVFQDAGTYYDEAIEKAYGYLRLRVRIDPSEEKWFFYSHLYVSQAMFNRGGPAWRSYFPKIRRRLLSMREGGHWQGKILGPAYATANALLILQLPNRLLPIHQR